MNKEKLRTGIAWIGLSGLIGGFAAGNVGMYYGDQHTTYHSLVTATQTLAQTMPKLPEKTYTTVEDLQFQSKWHEWNTKWGEAAVTQRVESSYVEELSSVNRLGELVLCKYAAAATERNVPSVFGECNAQPDQWNVTGSTLKDAHHRLQYAVHDVVNDLGKKEQEASRRSTYYCLGFPLGFLTLIGAAFAVDERKK